MGIHEERLRKPKLQRKVDNNIKAMQLKALEIEKNKLGRLIMVKGAYSSLQSTGIVDGGFGNDMVTPNGIVFLSAIIVASTLFVVVMTLILTTKLVGQYVVVDVIGLFMSTLRYSLDIVETSPGDANTLIHVAAKRGEDLSLGES
ncbi:hypothetical protein Tco_1234768 [Tanacetum coccineum]